MAVDAVVYFNVIDAEQALCSVDDFRYNKNNNTKPTSFTNNLTKDCNGANCLFCSAHFFSF